MARQSPTPPAFGIVFHRLGNMLAIRDLLLYGRNRATSTDLPVTHIGVLALCANDFVDRNPLPSSSPTNLELAVQVVRTWDIYNTRDLAYAMTRMYHIFTTILPSDNPRIKKTREGVEMKQLAIDGLTLPEFVAVAFALFAYGNMAERNDVSRVLIHPDTFFQQFPAAKPLLDKFLAGRALTVDQMSAALAGDEALTRERFLTQANDRKFLVDSLSQFRQHPLLCLDDGRVLILDLQFLSDLVTTGVYWLLFDSLSPTTRNAFRSLWGYCFEDYVINLLRDFYPSGSLFLSTNVVYAEGEIDGLLDFGSDVIIIEAKASLLTEAAKRNGDPKIFAEDVNRKFVKDDDAPKAVHQLIRATRAVTTRAIDTATVPCRVYPVLVTDEPVCECFAFNAYLDELFQQDEEKIAAVRPLTVMSINELEELLGYTSAGAFSWAELLETRFVDGHTTVWSVHQAIYDLRHGCKLQVHRNQPILERYEAIFEEVRRIFGATASSAADAPNPDEYRA